MIEAIIGDKNMEIDTRKRESTNYFFEAGKRKAGKEYALAKIILQNAASLEMQAWQVDCAFELCKKLYKESADKLLVAVEDADNVFNFSV